MKKLLAILLALILCVGTLSVVSFAANDITVHAYVPSDWTNPNVYSWPTGGDGATAWPGTAMTQEDGQWYVGTIPMTDQNLIINNGGAPQTADLAFDGGYTELWVVVGASDGSNAVVYYSESEVQMPSQGGGNQEQPSEPENPADPSNQFAPPSSLAIVGSGIPGVGEWNPGDAAGDMTAVSNLVYEIELPFTAGTTMTFKFAGNDAWDDTCNLGSGAPAIGATVDLVNGNTAGDMTLTADKDCVLKFTVDLTALAAKTGAATLTIAEVEGGTVEPPVDDEPVTPGEVVVYARIPDSWAAPNLYTWPTGGSGSISWPGTPMEKLDNGWYKGVMVPGDDNVIINDGSTQTADLAVDATQATIWVDVYAFDNAVVTYADPGERVEPTQPTEPETEPTEPTEPSKETEPTEATKSQEQVEAEKKAAEELRGKKKTHTILIIVMILVWVVVIAEVITLVLKKKS